MLTELLDLYAKCRDFDKVAARAQELAAENERLRLDLARAEIELAKVRKENIYLRHRLRESELRTLRRAEIDANLLSVLWLLGVPTSRRECERLGISRRRWAWARALLQVAHIIEGDEWQIDDMAAFDTRLAAGVRLVESQGMTRLIARTPRNGYAGRRFPKPRGHARGHAAGHARGHAAGHAHAILRDHSQGKPAR